MSELVSCLCVSQPNRYALLQRAILDYDAQTYEDKELIIVVDNPNYAAMIDAFASEYRVEDVSVITRPIKTQLDGLLFAGVHANGSIFVLWDDDNLNHPHRLKLQVATQMANRSAVTVMSNGLYLFYRERQLIAVDVVNPALNAGRRTLPSSMMAYRQMWPVMDYRVRGKPSEAMVTNAAIAGRKIVAIRDHPFSHVVGVCGDNIRTEDYHRGVAQTNGLASAEIEKAKTLLFETVLDTMRWDGPMSVEGRDKSIGTYTPKQTWPKTLYPILVG